MQLAGPELKKVKWGHRRINAGKSGNATILLSSRHM
jgi:hypothetical protein